MTDWQIGNGLADWSMIDIWLAECSWIVIGLTDW